MGQWLTSRSETIYQQVAGINTIWFSLSKSSLDFEVMLLCRFVAFTWICKNELDRRYHEDLKPFISRCQWLATHDFHNQSQVWPLKSLCWFVVFTWFCKHELDRGYHQDLKPFINRCHWLAPHDFHNQSQVWPLKSFYYAGL